MITSFIQNTKTKMDKEQIDSYMDLLFRSNEAVLVLKDPNEAADCVLAKDVLHVLLTAQVDGYWVLYKLSVKCGKVMIYDMYGGERASHNPAVEKLQTLLTLNASIAIASEVQVEEYAHPADIRVTREECGPYILEIAKYFAQNHPACAAIIAEELDTGVLQPIATFVCTECQKVFIEEYPSKRCCSLSKVSVRQLRNRLVVADSFGSGKKLPIGTSERQSRLRAYKELLRRWAKVQSDRPGNSYSTQNHNLAERKIAKRKRGIQADIGDDAMAIRMLHVIISMVEDLSAVENLPMRQKPTTRKSFTRALCIGCGVSPTEKAAKNLYTLFNSYRLKNILRAFFASSIGLPTTIERPVPLMELPANEERHHAIYPFDIYCTIEQLKHDFNKGEAAVSLFDSRLGSDMQNIDEYTRLRAEEISYRLKKYDEVSDYHNRLVELIKQLPRNLPRPTRSDSQSESHHDSEMQSVEAEDMPTTEAEAGSAEIDFDLGFDGIIHSLEDEQQDEFATVIVDQIWNNAYTAERQKSSIYDETEAMNFLESFEPTMPTPNPSCT